MVSLLFSEQIPNTITLQRKVNFDTVYQVSVSDGGFGSRDIDVYLSRSPGTHYVERAGLTLQDPSAS